MRAALLLSLFALSSLFALVIPACGGDDGDPPSNEQPDAGDGKVRPPPSGVHITEAAACDALLAAFEARRQALGCTVITSRTCPNLVRAQVGGEACLEYDEGSVNGCVAHYNEQTSCEALAEALDNCIATSYPGTQSANCP